MDRMFDMIWQTFFTATEPYKVKTGGNIEQRLEKLENDLQKRIDIINNLFDMADKFSRGIISDKDIDNFVASLSNKYKEIWKQFFRKEEGKYVLRFDSSEIPMKRAAAVNQCNIYRAVSRKLANNAKRFLLLKKETEYDISTEIGQLKSTFSERVNIEKVTVQSQISSGIAAKTKLESVAATSKKEPENIQPESVYEKAAREETPEKDMRYKTQVQLKGRSITCEGIKLISIGRVIYQKKDEDSRDSIEAYVVKTNDSSRVNNKAIFINVDKDNENDSKYLELLNKIISEDNIDEACRHTAGYMGKIQKGDNGYIQKFDSRELAACIRCKSKLVREVNEQTRRKRISKAEEEQVKAEELKWQISKLDKKLSKLYRTLGRRASTIRRRFISVIHPNYYKNLYEKISYIKYKRRNILREYNGVMSEIGKNKFMELAKQTSLSEDKGR